MKAMRPTRGRVTKPSPARGGRPGRATAAQLAAAHEALAEQQLKQDPQDPSVYDEAARLGAEQYAAAAAAAVMDPADMGDAQGDAEAEADLEDDDPAGSGLPPHVDLTTAANILANGGQPVDNHHPDLQQGMAHAHHQQPAAQMSVAAMQPAGQSPMDPSLVKTTQQLAVESGYNGLNIESALAKRLAREPGRRHAHQRRPEQVLNLARRSNVEALFAHIAGEPARVPCKNCHKGHGPWVSCIVVDGQMCGSCANCWFNASGARCSFHETRNPQTQQHPSMIQGTTASLPADPSYRFATPHAMMPSAPGPSLGDVHQPHQFTTSPLVQNIIARAMAEVRAGDQANRHLMHIEIAAKQLALHIVEYEDAVASQEAGQNPGQQVLGDESGP
ncbi:hypothetical protein QBC47DRAFT_180403 [Echria macrotheca]|uniref:Uncharacterized protein n=1 Tax=Echria macrotheca TaxID=438768 RepID=A0AAJ0F6W3_9PEZI|nr:hypothetical protein QBC47DRAFT_180403 [Echria macrotheca]